MSDPAVFLRLTGDGRPDRVEAWVRSLGRVPARARTLQIATEVLPAQLPSWCEDAGVHLVRDDDVEPNRPDVLVIACADDMPTPRSLLRLVAVAHRSSFPQEARTLPCGDVTLGGPEGLSRPRAPCIAVPRGATAVAMSADSAAEASEALRAGGIDVRRLQAAAVFVDAWPNRSTAVTPVSDGGVPSGPPAGMPSTSLHQLLLRAGMTPPGATDGATDGGPHVPFLTVVTRTQGTRLLMLEEALTCLAGQSSRDFEILVMCHRTPHAAGQAVRSLLDDMPAWLRDRSRVVDVGRPGRAAPLNDAIALARGRYLSVLDDDDSVTADWVATYAEMEVARPGSVLRASSLRQDVEPLPDADEGVGDVVPREIGPAVPGWPREFNLVDHLWDNASPFMSLAFPRGVYRDLAHRFDEALDAMEDWDYLLRAATVVGVSGCPRLTSVYRTWVHTEGSREVHHQDVWDAARQSVATKIDALPLVVPPGTMHEVRALHEALQEERAEKFRFAGLNEQAAADLRTVNNAVLALRERVAQLEERLARAKGRRET